MTFTDSSPIRVSHSQIQKWDRCRFKWWLSYEGKWQPKQKSDGLRLGSLVHEFLEHHYRAEMAGTGRDPVDRHVEFARSMVGGLDGDMLELFSRGTELVRRYIAEYALYEDLDWEVVDVEGYLAVPLTSPGGIEYEYELYYDVLMRHKPSGRIWLWDHKTHKSRPYTDTEVLMDPQLASYAMALRESGTDVFGVVYNLLNTYDYKKPPDTDKLFKRVKSYRTPEELDSIIKEIGYSVDDMVGNKDNPRRSLNRDCSWCEFQDPCLMAMKGMDIKIFLEDNFEKKPERPRETIEED